MASYNRRTFIVALVQRAAGITAALLAPHLLAGSSRPNHNRQPGSEAGSTQPQGEADSTQQLFREAKELFYRKEYGGAAQAYQQLQAILPSRIEPYDGMAKVYHAQHKQALVADMYFNALEKNKGNAAFHERYARSLASLCTGCYRQEMEFTRHHSFGINLLEVAAIAYREAIALAPDKPYLKLGLLDIPTHLERKNKVQEKVGNQPWTLSEATLEAISQAKSESVGQLWAHTRKPDKRTADNPEAALQKMEQKLRRTLYSAEEERQREEHMALQKTRVYYPLMQQAFKERKMQDAEKYALRILELAPQSTAALAVLRKLYAHQKQHGKLVALYQQRQAVVGSSWTQLALAKATLLQSAQSGNNSLQAPAKSMLKELDGQEYKTRKMDVAIRLSTADIFARSGQHKQARSELLKGLEALPPQSGLSVSLRLGYASSYAQENNMSQAYLLLQAMDNPSLAPKLASEPLLPNLKLLWQAPSGKTRPEVDMLCALGKMQKKLGKTQELSQTLAKLKAIAPKSKFVKKYTNR